MSRIAALALALSFLLGAAQPDACQSSGGEGGHHHSETPCTAPCHLAKAPAKSSTAALALKANSPAGEPGSLAVATTWRNASVPASPPEAAAAYLSGGVRHTLPPVRLHVFHAVFLN